MSNTTGKHQPCKQASMQTRPAHSLADSFHNEEVFVAVFVEKTIRDVLRISHRDVLIDLIYISKEN